MDADRYLEAERDWWATTGLTPASRRLRLPRLGVDVRIQEVGDGVPTLFLHGGPNSGSTWAPLVAHLPGLRCLLLDRPGTGLSDPMPDPVTAASLPGYADVLVADVLDALELDRVHVVCSSFGGYIALRSAAHSPERTGRMVQMACPALVQGMQLPPFMRAIAFRPTRWLMTALPPSERVGRAIFRQMGHGASLDTDRLPGGLFAWYLALQRYTDTMHHETPMIASLMSPFRGVDPSLTLDDDLLARVRCPVRFVWGSDDAFGGEAVARRLVGALPQAELEMLPGGGHLPWLDDPAQVGARTLGFLLEELAATSRG